MAERLSAVVVVVAGASAARRDHRVDVAGAVAALLHLDAEDLGLRDGCWNQLLIHSDSSLSHTRTEEEDDEQHTHTIMATNAPAARTACMLASIPSQRLGLKLHRIYMAFF